MGMRFSRRGAQGRADYGMGAVMKKTRLAIGAILLASSAAITMPLTAEAAGFGGGGGGFHGGGGGFHGGGGFGGFRGGGGGFGGFRGGGFQPGGGRIGSMNAGRIGGAPGGLSRQGFSGGSHPALQAGNSRQGLLSGNQANFGNRGVNSSLSRGPGQGLVATRAASGFNHNGFGHNGFRNGFGPGWGHGAWHSGFGPGFVRFAVFGWVGPLFWPYAYNDIYCGVFWGYWGFGCADPYWTVAFGDPFWGYGYDDIYGGLFSPFAYDDLAPYLPGYVSPSSDGLPAQPRRTPSGSPAGVIAQMCGEDTKEVAGWPIDRIQQLVSPDDQQRIALDDLANASMKAAQIIKSGCPTSVAFTPTGRLAAMEQRLEAMERAVATVREPLDTFYGSLTDEQKAKFNATGQPPAPAQQSARSEQAGEAVRDPAQRCTAANAAPQWPEARINVALRPNEAQQAKLRALQSAAAQAVEQLMASCLAELPTTPPARLAAISKRLDVMLTAVRSVRTALDDLYGDLSDEQKGQFNKIGQSRPAAPSQKEQRPERRDLRRDSI
jgi:hypothetical protein